MASSTYGKIKEEPIEVHSDDESQHEEEMILPEVQQPVGREEREGHGPFVPSFTKDITYSQASADQTLVVKLILSSSH